MVIFGLPWSDPTAMQFLHNSRLILRFLNLDVDQFRRGGSRDRFDLTLCQARILELFPVRQVPQRLQVESHMSRCL